MIFDLTASITTCFDLMIDSKHNIIDVELELKLIANFSNLNDLKNLLNLIFDCDLKTTTISCSIVFLRRRQLSLF